MAPREEPRTEAERRAAILGEMLATERPRLLAQARRHSSRSEDAEDALGDASVQFLRHYSGPPGDEALHWMLTVVKRSAWQIARRRRNREAEDVTANLEAAGGADPAELAERSEEATEIAAAITALKPDERAALLLRGLGLSHGEIAELRAWSLTKVRRLLREGRAKVRERRGRGVNP
jgi:RNA polymerase sigma factor (sigma-70 family)